MLELEPVGMTESVNAAAAAAVAARAKAVILTVATLE